MGVLTCAIPRASWRRATIRHHQVLCSVGKRNILTDVERSVSTPSKEGIQTSTSDVGFPWRVWNRLRPPYKIVKAYGKAQEKRPYMTQVGSLVTIWCCGDILAQSLEDEDYDLWRTLRHMSIGCIVSIPSYKWCGVRNIQDQSGANCSLLRRFMYLGRSFNYASKFRSLATKVIVNQIVFAPLFNTYFFGMQSLLSGASLMDAWERIKNTVPISWIISCKFWPIVTAFNFTYIGPQYRSLFAGQSPMVYRASVADIWSGLVALGWQAYLSWLNQRAANEEKARKISTTIISQSTPTR